MAQLNLGTVLHLLARCKDGQSQPKDDVLALSIRQRRQVMRFIGGLSSLRLSDRTNDRQHSVFFPASIDSTAQR